VLLASETSRSKLFWSPRSRSFIIVRRVDFQSKRISPLLRRGLFRFVVKRTCKKKRVSVRERGGRSVRAFYPDYYRAVVKPGSRSLEPTSLRRLCGDDVGKKREASTPSGEVAKEEEREKRLFQQMRDLGRGENPRQVAIKRRRQPWWGS